MGADAGAGRFRPGVVLLFGPTGVGKTALIEELFSGRGEVVSADALQVYRKMDIGTAKPGAELLEKVPHHLVDILDFTENFNVADFCTLADRAVAGILSRGRVPVISGGTAYYLRAWLMGVPDTPRVDESVRKNLAEFWRERGDDELLEAVRAVDEPSAARLGRRDRYRMLRVLEVFEQTGRPLSAFRVPDTPRSDYRILSIGLKRERPELYRRIDLRVELMMKAGLEGEIRALVAGGARKEHPGMKGIGYREWFDGAGREDVASRIARSTRRYAKRQMTFFRSLPGVRWYDAGEPGEMRALRADLEAFLAG